MRGLPFVVVSCLVAAACGDDGNVNNLPDAPVFLDAPDVDAPTSGVVKLTIKRGATPIQGVVVHFQNADSSVVSSTTTDGNGVASATMEPGGFVTAIDPFNAALPTGIAFHDLRTFAGVKPGDELVLAQPGEELGVTFTLLLPVDPNAAFYLMYAPCTFAIDVTDTDGSGGVQGPGGPVTLSGCGATTDLTIVAHDGNGVPINSIAKSGVAITEGGTVDLTADSYTAVPDVAWSYASVPDNIGSLDVSDVLVTPRGPVFDTFVNGIVNAGTATLTAKRPVVAGALQVTDTRLFGPAFGGHHVLQWGPPTADFSLVLANVLLSDYNASPVFDIATDRVTWTVDAGGAAPELAIANISFDRAGNAPQFWGWQIAAPLVTEAVALPVLPGTDATYNPVDGDSAFVDQLTTAKVPGGYDAVRENALSLLQNPTGLVVGASGQVVFEELQPQELRRTRPSARQVLRPWVRPARVATRKRR